MHFNPTSQPEDDIFVAKITDVEASPPIQGAPVAHAWKEQRADANGRGYLDHEEGRKGSKVQFPAFDVNGASYAVGTLVFLRLRGWSNLASNASETAVSGKVYDIVGSASGGGVCTPIITNINFTNCTYTIRYAHVISISDAPC